MAKTSPVWSPSKERIANAQLTKFVQTLSNRFPATPDYETLWRWSVNNPAEFWAEVARFCKVQFRKPAERILQEGSSFPERGKRGAEWFVGAELNFAENLLRSSGDKTAIIFRSEMRGIRRELTFKQLNNQVAALQKYLQNIGVKRGDRVAGYLPNLPETIVGFLATSSIGGVWSSGSPDFGIQGIVERFGQISPKVLFIGDFYFYGGRKFSILERLSEIRKRIPSIEHVIVVNYDVPDTAYEHETFANIVKVRSLSAPEFVSLPFSERLAILYSSGTTGVPKCIVHGAGGTLLQHLKELVLHTDLTSADRLFYYTTCGWMMWNWMVTALAVEATIVLFDGNPFTPTSSALFDILVEEEVSIFGTSARFLMSSEKAGVVPKSTHSLPKLRTILSTGSPLPPSSFDYVYQHIKDDVCLSSISGGTDIISCFVLGNPTLPVYRGEIQVKGLGMNVAVLDPEVETPTPLPVGEAGELCCLSPFPSMPVEFWNDPNFEKYFEAYFAQYPNVWRHGDWAELTPNHGVIIYGRSDAVLNPGGVRIGTAEIYRVVEQIDEILECIAVGQPWDGDERIILFVKLKPDVAFSKELIEKVRNNLKRNASPRHVPAKIIAVPDIPRTKNGKLVELAVKNLLCGRAVKNTEALANPEALQYFANLEELNS